MCGWGPQHGAYPAEVPRSFAGAQNPARAYHARFTQVEWTIAPNALAAASPDVRRLDFSRGGLGASSYSVAVDEANRRVDDNLLALFDPIGYFHLRA